MLVVAPCNKLIINYTDTMASNEDFYYGGGNSIPTCTVQVMLKLPFHFH